MNNFPRFILISFFFVYCGSAGCGGPGKSNPTDEDTCTGDSCGTPDSEVDKDQTEIDIPEPDNKAEDVEQDEESPCKNPCDTEGYIKCDDTLITKYRVCQEKDGCLQWGSPALCLGENIKCACGELGLACEVLEKGPCTCEPICEADWQCGPNGCGETCGDVGCADTEICVDHMCVEDINCECPGGDECGEFESQCNGADIQPCQDIYADKACETKCWKFADSEPCGDFQTCQFDECTCQFTDCPDGCCGSADHVCFNDGCCLPDCEGLECGDDGCGGTCGECGEGCFCADGECDCSGNCPEDGCSEGVKTCTQDKQGYYDCVSMGEPCPDTWVKTLALACDSGTQCLDGECVCKPNCTGKECGNDSCDGSCGDCQEGWTCNADGSCECTCAPIDNKVCDLATGKTYPNACEANCAGVDPADINKGACPTCEDLCTEDETQSGPMCAVDSATYASFCQLKCTIGDQECELGDCAQVFYAGACQPENCDICKGEPFNPICNLDSMVTYYSKCDFLSCYPDCDPDTCTPAENICNGECADGVKCPDCNADCEPVCGLLGGLVRKTYMNECMLECEGADLFEDGDCCVQCDNEAIEWVCGSDFKAYGNQCKLGCKAPEQDALYFIPQNPDGTFNKAVCEICQVDLSGEPEQVCGDNYQTYYNIDELICAAEQDGKVGLEPQCQAECFTAECPCPPETGGLVIPNESQDPADTGQRGVCGADGATYANNCEAIYMGTTVTASKWCDACGTPDKCQGETYSPYCCTPPGADFAVTYPNSCIAEKCNPNIIIGNDCNKGRCCLLDDDCEEGEICNPLPGLVTGVCE